MKQVTNYPNYYVTKDGDVWSVRSKKFLKPLIDSRYGYVQVHLCKDGVVKNKKVHRLVAETFIPNPDNLPQVNHKDEDKTNNHVDNLEWCTNQYNGEYSHSKCYTMENMNTGETFEVYNLRRWCRENKVWHCSLYKYGHSKGYRVIKGSMSTLTL